MSFVLFVRTDSGRRRGEAAGDLAHPLEAVLAAGQFPGELRGDDCGLAARAGSSGSAASRRRARRRRLTKPYRLRTDEDQGGHDAESRQLEHIPTIAGADIATFQRMAGINPAPERLIGSLGGVVASSIAAGMRKSERLSSLRSRGLVPGTETPRGSGSARTPDLQPVAVRRNGLEGAAAYMHVASVMPCA